MMQGWEEEVKDREGHRETLKDQKNAHRKNLSREREIECREGGERCAKDTDEKHNSSLRSERNFQGRLVEDSGGSGQGFRGFGVFLDLCGQKASLWR